LPSPREPGSGRAPGAMPAAGERADVRPPRHAYAPVASEADAPPSAVHWRGRRVAAIAAISSASAIAAAGWRLGAAVARSSAETIPQLRRSGPSETLQLKDEEPTWVQGAKFPSHAPAMDIDMEYHFEGWGTNYDHIPDPEFCAAMCQGVAKCQGYTWVKDAGLDGCKSQCWLKGGVGKKVPKKGVVSGVPPARKPLPTPGPRLSKPGTSLYCFALMVPGGYEQGLLKWQHDHKAGIFGCEGFDVYSNSTINLANGVVAHKVNSTLQCGYGGDSQSALNSWIFIAVWYEVVKVGAYKKFDWVTKVDPDAVFFPDRLRSLLAPHAGAGGYLNNCKYGMHGPIEVFSTSAIEILAKDYASSWDGKAPVSCVKQLHFGQWGEDMFIDQCMDKVLRVKPRLTEPKLMCESHCDCPSWYWCKQGPDVVSYHPFKSIESFSNCMANAAADQVTE